MFDNMSVVGHKYIYLLCFILLWILLMLNYILWIKLVLFIIYLWMSNVKSWNLYCGLSLTKLLKLLNLRIRQTSYVRHYSSGHYPALSTCNSAVYISWQQKRLSVYFDWHKRWRLLCHTTLTYFASTFLFIES